MITSGAIGGADCDCKDIKLSANNGIADIMSEWKNSFIPIRMRDR